MAIEAQSNSTDAEVQQKKVDKLEERARLARMRNQLILQSPLNVAAAAATTTTKSDEIPDDHAIDPTDSIAGKNENQIIRTSDRKQTSTLTNNPDGDQSGSSETQNRVASSEQTSTSITAPTTTTPKSINHY